MRLEDLLENKKEYTSRIAIYLDDVKEEDKDEVAGMLRGLMCAIEGWGAISGVTNELFSSNSPVVLDFKSVENAHRFKGCVDYYFSPDILEKLKLKKRFIRVT